MRPARRAQKVGGQDLHVAGQHDHVGPLLVDDRAPSPSKAAALAAGSVPTGTQRKRTPCHSTSAAQVLVVGDHAGDVALELARPPAVEEVGQAVVLLAREQHHPLGHVGVAQVPLHVELGGDGLEGRGQLVGAEAGREALGHDLDAQEERPVVRSPCWAASSTDPPVRGDQPGDGGHDADPVRAGDGEDVAPHGLPRPTPSRRGPRRRRRARSAPHMSANSRCTRRSGVSSGWNDDASTGPWRTSTGAPSSAASTSTSSPDRHDQRRPDEDGGQRRALARADRLGLERLPLAPVAVAADHGVEHAEACAGRAARRAPRAATRTEPGAGAEHRQVAASARRAATASNSPVDSSSIDSVVDSPPGSTSPSSPSSSAGRLTEPGRRSPRRRARPRARGRRPAGRARRRAVRGPLPPPVGEMLAVLRRLQPAHRLAQPARDLGHVLGVRRSAPSPRRWPTPCGPGPTT